MEGPLYNKEEPPYKWLKAYEFGDKTFYKRKNIVVKYITSEYTHLKENSCRLVKITSFRMNLDFDIGIYRDMTFDLFKKQVILGIKKYSKDDSRIGFEYGELEDIMFTNYPDELGAAIDFTKNDLFTVLPDNGLVFLSQIKINGLWYFYK